jgi:hypothetical protein
MNIRLAAAISILSVIIWPAAAGAKGKKVSNGCTAAQIQSAAAHSCGVQMEQDIINDSPTMHALYCSSSGAMLCCEYSGNSIVDHSCTVVGRKLLRIPQGNLETAPAIQVQ